MTAPWDDFSTGEVVAGGPGVGPVAVIDNDPRARFLIQDWLLKKGYQTDTYENGQQVALDAVERPAVVILALEVETPSGMEVLQQLNRRDPDLPVIVTAGRDDRETADAVMNVGAYDYLVKPFNRQRLVLAVKRAVERRRLALSVLRLQSALSDRHPLHSLVGQSNLMKELIQQVHRLLDNEIPVAIFGETGVGKSHLAKTIHYSGHRRNGPFVELDCRGLPDELHTIELFGQESVAAGATPPGRYERAHTGTMFISEIDRLSQQAQGLLLRTMQKRVVRRLGSHQEMPIDVRIICATSSSLLDRVREGLFREDLYFALMTYPLKPPPLRERREDIPLLVEHFLERFRAQTGRDVRRIRPEAMEALVKYDWPQNVQELEGVLHRAVLSSEGHEMLRKNLPPEVRDHSAATGAPVLSETADANQSWDSDSEVPPLRELERWAIKRALQATDGSVEKAAKLLGIGRATLYRRLARYESTEEKPSES